MDTHAASPLRLPGAGASLEPRKPHNALIFAGVFVYFFPPGASRGSSQKMCIWCSAVVARGARAGRRRRGGGGKGDQGGMWWVRANGSPKSPKRGRSGVRCNDVASKNRASSRTGQSSRPGWNGRNKERSSSHPNQHRRIRALVESSSFDHVASACGSCRGFHASSLVTCCWPCTPAMAIQQRPTCPHGIRGGQIGGRLEALAKKRTQEVHSANTGKY